ncbi:MAG: TIGR03564 family F420-dependent LLM class oxidoreductase [Chloroflexi bacterium]|nr:TIGR03564 family F420-dependent LLM class oxidoreductase [Chloroflexota bacterium]
MRIGITLPTPGDAPGLPALLDRMADADGRGLATVWMPHITQRGYDALTTLALAAGRTRAIELATWVVPTFPRHPVALAQQALTVQVASGGRLTLGIGLSHRVSMEGAFGFDFSRPVRHMREYLTCLRGLLAGAAVSFEGEEFHIRNFALAVPGATPPPVLVAALGPGLLRLAGALADGTVLWMGGPRYVAEHVVPVIDAAAVAAGRPAPRVQACVPVCVTDRPDAVRAAAVEAFVRYGQLPSYRAILDKEGADGPADVALIGDEATVRAGVAAFAAAGATDFSGAPFTPPGEDASRTLALLAALAAGTPA